jgi:phosphoglycolate phosphatase
MNKKYELIVFDWDGTLMDSTIAIIKTFQDTALELGLSVPSAQKVRDLIGLNIDNQLDHLYSADLDRDRYVPCFRKYQAKYFAEEVDFFPDALETLICLRENRYKLAIATSKYRKQLTELLVRYKIQDLFAAERCGDDGYPKPQAEMLLSLLDELGVKANAAVMVGDSEYDMILAKNAEVDAIAASYGVHSKNRLLAYNPIACIDNIKDLYSILSKQFIYSL